MKTLHIAVLDKVATYRQRDGEIVCGNADYQISFAFDSEWLGAETKTARFIYGNQFTDVVFTGDTCAVPVMRNVTQLTVGVFAGDLMTTTPASIPCVKSIRCEDGAPAEPTPDVYDQIMAKINERPKNDVTAYGAKGDGGADDTAAFKAALAAERVVFVPGGVYKLSDGLVVRENCMLELAQDAVLEFTQTSGNAITLLRLANIKGNHATVNVPYAFSGNVINCDTGEDEARLDPDNLAATNATAVPPFKKWSPQWKMSRYVTDINICKPKADGEHNSVDGACSGTAVYVHCNADDFVSFMWGVSMSGIRIAGAFNYGIRAYNIGAHVESWNHDMRIEAVIDACKVGVSLENCYYARLEVSVQARSAANGTAYAVHGIELKDSRGVDLSGSRVWDWNETNSLWASGNEYQHLALYGECRGLILDDFVYYESSTPLRELIYTNKSSNFEQMTILQEPITKWFKPKNGEPIFSDGFNEKKLITQDHLDAHFDTDVVKNFTDVLATATDESGAVLDGKGYTGGFLTGTGVLSVSGSAEAYYRTTGFIPCTKGQTMYVEGMSYVSYDGSCTLCMYDAQKKFISTVSAANLVKGSYWYAAYSATANGFTVTPQAVVGNENVAYIRFTVLKSQMGEYPMIAVDEEIKYTVEGFLANSVKVKAENVVGLNPDGSFDASGFVKSVNGNTPDENGNVEIDLPDGGGHFVEGAGELVFSHTATFATDSEATLGVPVPGVSVVATLNAVYWLEVNGEMLKCHWEKDSSSSGMILNTRILYDEGRNEWVRSMSGTVMVYAQTPGTYTYSLYAPSNDPMLDPRYIPANVAKKSDIPTGGSGGGIPYIVGNSTTAGKWTGECAEITEYYEGLTVLYKLNVAGTSGGTTLDINGLGAATVYCNASTAIRTTYPIGSVVMLTYSEGKWLTADANVDTRNTAGTGALSDTKLFLVGSRSQNANGVTTNTNSGVYIGTNNELYSNGKRVATKDDILSVIDVTAEVGQTIIVKEVDASGKPTKWESADYQPRTHWCDETIGDLVPYTVFTPVLNEQLQMFVYPLPVFDFEAGKNYTVIFDGVEYVGTASAGTFNGIPFISVGNTYLHGAQSEEPFIVISIPAMNMLSVVCFSSDEHVIRVVGEKTVYHKIPSDFLKYVCHITRSISGDSDYCEFFTDWEELREAVKSGRQVVAEYSSQEGDMDFYFTTFRLEHAELGIVDSEQGWTDILFFANKASYGMFSEISVYRHADGTVEAKVSG